MRISVKNLRMIIAEVMERILTEHEQSIVRRGRNLYIIDDEGNEEYYGPASEMPGFRDGEEEDYEPPSRRNRGRSSFFNAGREPWERERW